MMVMIVAIIPVLTLIIPCLACLQLSSSIHDEKQPAFIEGWVDKKGGGKMSALAGGEWQKRYMRIDLASGGVSYSKTSK